MTSCSLAMISRSKATSRRTTSSASAEWVGDAASVTGSPSMGLNPRAPREPGGDRLAVHPVPPGTKQVPPARPLADDYLPVFALWAAAVVVFLPPSFGFG